MRKLYQRLWDWWYPCPHKWRPARTSKGPAKYCELCDSIVQMSTEDFYAYFGRMPF